MEVMDQTREKLLDALNNTVADAAAFLASASPVLSDGRHTAHGVLSQLVYWHECYANVLSAISQGQRPDLMDGTQDMLNASARHRYARELMVMLAERLSQLQQQVDTLLRDLPDWSINFPVKRDSGFCNVYERVGLVEEHIRHHVAILHRAYRP